MPYVDKRWTKEDEYRFMSHSTQLAALYEAHVLSKLRKYFATYYIALEMFLFGVRGEGEGEVG